MAAYSINAGMKRKTNERLIKKAESLKPVLVSRHISPADIVEVDGGGRVRHRADIGQIGQFALGKGDSIVIDFGDHQVGYLTFSVKSVGSPQDAPAFMRLKFGEIAKEINERSDDYDGWISRGWIQEEFIHVDSAPAAVRLPRRYAFRYVEIMMIDTSPKYKIVIESAECEAVSSVDMTRIPPLNTADERLRRMDRVSLRTLQNCMQEVFEDGPKRDRRLWIGDLRLQALVNYATFRQMDLVKRCLYLFAGQTRDDGAVGACIFTEPHCLVDDTFLLDYSLFFVAILRDYLRETNDLETARELWSCARRQIEIAASQMDERHIIRDQEGFWCFLDWTEGLNKQAGAQAVYIYALRAAVELARALGKEEEAAPFEEEIERSRKAALEFLWDCGKKVFVSGDRRQVSYASQVWMVLAHVLPDSESRDLLLRIIDMNPEKGMATPYMYHHFVMALLECGERERALQSMEAYWGGMLDQGADTFWELYNPANPGESPYGSSIVNSYCHAWSCTPAYLLRRVLNINQTD